MEVLFFWIMMAVICGMVASSKGRSFGAYFGGGLVLWPIVLVYAMLRERVVPAPPPAVSPHASLPQVALVADVVSTSSLRASPSPQYAGEASGAAAFIADGMVAKRPYRQEHDGTVTILMQGREVRFRSLAAAEAAFDNDTSF